MNTDPIQLEERLAQAVDERQRIDALNQLGWALRLREPERALNLSQAAWELSHQGDFQSQPYTKGKAYSLLCQGNVYLQQAHEEKALACLLESQEYMQQVNDMRGLAVAQNEIASVYLHLGKILSALQALLISLEQFESIQDPPWEAALLNNIGSLHVSMGEFDKALAYLKKSLAISEPGEFLQPQANALLFSCQAYHGLGDLNHARAAGEKSARIFQELSSEQGYAQALVAVGEIYQAQANYTDALANFQQAVVHSRTGGLDTITVQAMYKIGEIYRQLGKTDQAINQFKTAQAAAEKINSMDTRLNCHRALTAIYKQKGEFALALENAEKYQALKEEQYQADANLRLKSLQIIHQVETNRKEAELYRSNTAALQQEINYRLQAEERIRIANQQLQQEVAAREQLIAELNSFSHMVAHDLKNPLHTITLGSSMLRNLLNKTASKEALKMLEILLQTSERMGRIIDELLLLASMQHEKVVLQPVDMNKILRDVETSLNSIIRESKARIIKPDDWPLAMGHAPWVEEIWANYITNAIKYGGEPPVIKLGATPQHNGSVQFWIKDNGNGLSLETQAELFTAFTRFDRVRAQGYGLGLSIVKRIVEKLGGEVAVSSRGQPGQGSTFSFTLPAVPPDGHSWDGPQNF